MLEVASAGIEAKKRHDWRTGYELLKQALVVDPDNPDILAPLADCAWWLTYYDEAIDYRERAYSGSFKCGNWENAARIALKLSFDYANRGQVPIASGWRARAEDLLAGKPPSAAHAELRMRQGQRAYLADRDPEAAFIALDEATALARRHADHDLEMWALQIKADILVGIGQVKAGLDLMDQTVAAAVGGELGPFVAQFIYCHMIEACEKLGDVERASQWSEAQHRYCQRTSLEAAPSGDCRMHRARIMQLRGTWQAAEREARDAADILTRGSFAYAHALALGDLAEIRRRLGDLQGAWAIAQKAIEIGVQPEPMLSLLIAERDGAEVALYRLEKELRGSQADRFRRARLIPTFTEMAIACRKPEMAEEYVAELEALAAVGGTSVLRAFAQGTRGRLQAAKGDQRAARVSLERAIVAWSEAAVPFEGARDRLALAQVLQANQDRIGARTEAEEALRVFEELGAAREAERARAFLTQLAAPLRPVAKAAALMFTDLAGSTALVEAIGDEAWRDLRVWLDGAMRGIFKQHEGKEIDHAGDGFFVLFESAGGAVDCAVAIQRRLQAHRREHGYSPQVRIGIHCGRVSEASGAVSGAAVNRTARICALADGGQILASRDALESCGRPCEGPRIVSLRGVRGGVEVALVDWSAAERTAAP